jgi:hypothetical protein
LNVNQSANLYLHFPQSEVQSNSDGVAFTLAKLKTSPDIDPHLYTIPVHYNVTTKSFVAHPLMFKNTRVIQIGETEPLENLDYLTISVLPKESLAERSETLFKSYGGWLNLVLSFIVGLLGVMPVVEYISLKNNNYIF